MKRKLRGSFLVDIESFFFKLFLWVAERIFLENSIQFCIFQPEHL